MFSDMDSDNDSCVCAPAAGESWDPCDPQTPKHANKKVWAWYYRPRISHQPPPAVTRGARWHTTPTVKHFISNLPRMHMMVSPVTPVVDRLHGPTETRSSFLLINCKTEQRGLDGNVTSLQMEAAYDSSKEERNRSTYKDVSQVSRKQASASHFQNKTTGRKKQHSPRPAECLTSGHVAPSGKETRGLLCGRSCCLCRSWRLRFFRWSTSCTCGRKRNNSYKR